MSMLQKTERFFTLLEKTFKSVDFNTVRMPVSSTNPIEHLLVGPCYYMTSLGQYDKQRQFFIDLVFLNDIYQHLGGEGAFGFETLQLSMVLPVEVPPAQLAEVSLVLSLFNTMLPIGYFVLTRENTLYFRYGLRAFGRNFDPTFVLNIVSLLVYFVGRMAFQIEAVSLGHKDFMAAVQETLESLAAMPPAQDVPE